ncbi:MAG: phosphoribosylformylglycinamidine synthase subunit PurL [Candidatus Micrarchaeia archaeon]
MALTKSEEKELIRRLGRAPNELEYGMTDILWSEHCSYKSSRPLLKMLPTRGPQVVVGPGFDAGVVDIGGGWCVAFKIESHNHPSALEPYGGAGTGIGGIIRDILAMGAQPVALLDSLRFGSLSSPHSQWLFRYVVKGIGDYGNCVGVPTVAGDIEFDASFERNCLVNCACVGFVRRGKILVGKARKAGDLLVLAGGSTGRDGLHGVTFASRVLSEESEDDRPAVQIPGPFTKKLIIDATLEAVERGLLVALKDLGGGGLTCAVGEMVAKAGLGADIDVDKVFVRESGMRPYEIMLSESQERMLYVVEEKRVGELEQIFKKYEVAYAVIGRVTDDGNVTVRKGDEIVARMPARILTEAPVQKRAVRRPAYLKKLLRQKPKKPTDLRAALPTLLSSENICSRAWVYQQYDHEVGDRTAVKPGQADAAVILAPNGKAIAVKSDCNANHVYLSPRQGAALAVAEACRNLACVGARAIALVDNLNYGNPEKPDVMWFFSESLKGLRDACLAFDIPCVGGNVSFYNEDAATGKAVKPAPVVVVVGIIDRLEHIRTLSFKREGNAILLVGKTRGGLGGSELWRSIHGVEGGRPPRVELREERRNRDFVLDILPLTTSIHDVSRGGLAVALAEMAIAGNRGANVVVEESEAMLYGESGARYVIESNEPGKILQRAKRKRIPCQVIGSVGAVGGPLSIGKLSWELDELRRAFESPLWKVMEGKL